MRRQCSGLSSMRFSSIPIRPEKGFRQNHASILLAMHGGQPWNGQGMLNRRLPDSSISFRQKSGKGRNGGNSRTDGRHKTPEKGLEQGNFHPEPIIGGPVGGRWADGKRKPEEKKIPLKEGHLS